MGKHRKEDKPDRKDETVPKFRPIMPKTNTTADRIYDRHSKTDNDKDSNDRDSRK